MRKQTVKNMLFGVQHPETYELLGVVRRSGKWDVCGHFAFVDISVEGKIVTASDAEARIFPFHSFSLDHLPKDGWPAVGWCTDHNTFAFLVDGKICEVLNGRTFEPIKEDIWQPEWRDRLSHALQAREGKAAPDSTHP